MVIGHADANAGIRTLAVQGQGGHALDFAAHFHAAQTANALAHVAGHAVGGFVQGSALWFLRQLAGEAIARKAYGFPKILQFAIAMAHTGHAVLVVVRKDKFHLCALHVTHMARNAVDHHAVRKRGFAGCGHAFAVFIHDFHKAYPAGCRLVAKGFELAQAGNKYSIAFRQFQNGFPIPEGIFLSIDRNFHRASFLCATAMDARPKEPSRPG